MALTTIHPQVELTIDGYVGIAIDGGEEKVYGETSGLRLQAREITLRAYDFTLPNGGTANPISYPVTGDPENAFVVRWDAWNGEMLASALVVGASLPPEEITAIVEGFR